MNDSIVVTRPRSTPVLRALLVAVVVNLVGALANAIANYALGWTALAPWLVAPIATVVGELVLVVIDHVAGRSTGRWFTGPLAAVLVVLLIGVVGSFGAVWAKYGVEWFTGNESGQQLLAQPVTNKKEGLAMSVTGVEETPHFLRVEVTLRNFTSNPLQIPVFAGAATLNGRDGTTLSADSRRSHWTDTLAPGATQDGILVFPDDLPARVKRASLSLNHIVPGGFEGPTSITVRGLRLMPRD
jgi:hypothetical protein